MKRQANSHPGSFEAANSERRRFIQDAAVAAAGVSVAAWAAAADQTSSNTATSASAQIGAGNCTHRDAPMKDVKGKVAFVTGGSSGIGLGIVEAFAAAGMKVAFTYRNPKHLDAAMLRLEKVKDRIHAINVDVTDRPGLEQAAKETVKVFGKVHALVNNAGVIIPEKLSETSYKAWDWLLDVNLNGPFNGIQAFLPMIKAHGEGGQIITTSSILGLFASAGGAAYSTSKFALIGMMESLRAELADTNIGASVFCPGTVSSSIEETSQKDRPADPAVKNDPAELERIKKVRADRELMMEPLEAGRIVLRGMRNNDLYIISHPEYEAITRLRSEALLGATPADLRPTEARLAMSRKGIEQSIYAVERRRQLCAAKAGTTKS